ncbi:MAG TPA: M48 family metalloprotease [Luteimonas sp.]|nr:M48 family metalloprotease [Luteimonas sp.]HRO26253.1 M48 family metalloprotease [Luteimonas sp.]HRP72472.1 M48 family metalloprotease [Luteimonas sp.]
MHAVAEAGSPAELVRRMAPGSVPRPARRPLYTLMLWLVAALSALMPVLYFGLVAALAWLGYRYYAGWAPRDGHAVLLALAWLAPGFMLTVLILFLLKPLFAPRAKAPESVRLSPDDEPELTAAVQSLCQAIGVRPPREILLSHSVNAWVQFIPGLPGVVGGARTLTIGLPLAAGMTARQLVGVLAHEFGHFAQRGGMRAAYVINHVNRWLESRAYHPDEWDARLQRWIEGDDDDSERGGLFEAVCLATLACLQATRLLMRGMFQINFRMSRRLSQEMEFDADRYEVAVAGSDNFAATALRLRALSQAMHEVEQANRKAWREGKLVDNLAEAAALRLGQWRKEDWQAIERQLDHDDETRYWDSHPADQARIANATSQQVAGMFVDERPAVALFTDFTALCRRVTEHYYEGMGLEFGSRSLIAPAQLLGMGRLPDELSESWKRFGNDMLGAPPLIEPTEAGLLPASGFDWQGSVDELRRLGPDAAGLWPRLQRRRARADELALWVRLIDMDASFVMPDGSEPDGGALRVELAACLDEKSPDRKLATRIGALFARRLHLGVAALEGAAKSSADLRWTLLGQLHGAWPKLHKLVSDGSVCLRLQAGMSGEAEELRPRVYALGERYREDLTALLATLDAVVLPDSEMLGRHLRGRCGRLSSAGSDPFEFIRVTTPIEDAFLELYQRVLAELAHAVDAAERAHGIRPIRLFIAGVTAR